MIIFFLLFFLNFEIYNFRNFLPDKNFCKYENIQGRGKVNFLLWHRVASVSDYPQCGRNGGGVSHWYVSLEGCSWFTVPIKTHVCFRLYQWIHFGFSITHKLWLFSSYGNSLWKFHPLLKPPAPSLFHIAVFFFFPVWKFIEPVPASSEAPNFPLHPHLCCISELQPVFDNCEQGEKQTDKNYSWIFEIKNVVFLCFTFLCILSNNSMSSFAAEVEEGDW